MKIQQLYTRRAVIYPADDPSDLPGEIGRLAHLLENPTFQVHSHLRNIDGEKAYESSEQESVGRFPRGIPIERVATYALSALNRATEKGQEREVFVVCKGWGMLEIPNM